jgi:predicted ester cyclase
MSTRKIGLLLFAVLVIAASLWGGALAQDTPACEGEYLESVRELGTIYVSALNAGDLDPWYEVLADNFESYGPNADVWIDKDAARANAEGLFVSFPGFQTEIHFSTVSADCRFVTYYWTSSGVFGGPLGNLPPNGQPGAVSGINIAEIEDGKIVRAWNAYDLMSLLASFGVTVEMSTPESNGGLTAEIAADFVPRFDAIINEDSALARELFHEAFSAHLPFAPQLDRESWIAYVEMFRASFPDIQQTTNFMFHAGDKLVVHVTYNATFSGQPFFGAEPNGAPVVMNGIGIFRFEDGQPVENFAVLDIGELFVQIGLVTPPAPAQ